jgi:hypothetical protein
MLRKSFHSIIIGLVKTILPILGLLLFAPWLINQTASLKHWQQILSRQHYLFLMLHMLFYFSLIGLWPKLVNLLKSSATTQKQYRLALQARWYLLGSFLFIELISRL